MKPLNNVDDAVDHRPAPEVRAEPETAGQIASRPPTLVEKEKNPDWRVPAGCSGYIMHGPSRELWSQKRPVPAKNGSTRTINSRLIKPVKGRVSLSINGVRITTSLVVLWQKTFPDLDERTRIEKYGRSIRRCTNGHPLGADVTAAYWGGFNRVCRLCFPYLPERPNFGSGNYSVTYGISATIDDLPSPAAISA